MQPHVTKRRVTLKTSKPSTSFPLNQEAGFFNQLGPWDWEEEQEHPQP